MAKLSFKYVPPDGLPGGAPPRPESPAASAPLRDHRMAARSFHESSWELQRGLQVREDAQVDIPSELFQELFGS